MLLRLSDAARLYHVDQETLMSLLLEGRLTGRFIDGEPWVDLHGYAPAWATECLPNGLAFRSPR
jgi:hypothetical protein